MGRAKESNRDKRALPKVNEEDIEWVRALMQLSEFDEDRKEFLKCQSTVDLSACPGSGKTTLVVAKLAILAKKWPHHTRGICVLSHTNVARELVEKRLGQTVVGQKLLIYPHFIGTIHGFVNRFLALPWLYSKRIHSPTVDNDLTNAYRRSVLGSQYSIVQNFLKHKKSDFDQVRICNRKLEFGLGSKSFPAGPNTQSYKLVKRAIEQSYKAGYFCHDEMFVWAEALLEDQKNYRDWLAYRFPFLAIDEMQDTSSKQGLFLNSIFPRNSTGVVIQRVGDPNQKIFDLSEENSGEFKSYPDEKRCLEIPNSYRFGQDIASLASPFAVRPVGDHGLLGKGPGNSISTTKKCTHTIFVFPDESTEGVLEAYGKHVLEVFGDTLLTKGKIAAVGHIHRKNPDVNPGHSKYPNSVGDYWLGYAPDLARRDSNPSTFVEYIRIAQGLVADGRSLFAGVDKIATAVIRLTKLIGEVDGLKRKSSKHRTILEALEHDAKQLEMYKNFLKSYLIEKITLSEDDWPAHARELENIAMSIIDVNSSKNSADKFLTWPNDYDTIDIANPISQKNDIPNVFRVGDGSSTVDIQLGSIHSVKGQTHVATLVLSTFWHKHSAMCMLPWLLGNKVNKSNSRDRDVKRLLHYYVAMTRSSHLLCLAIPRSSLGGNYVESQNITKLKARGWRIEFVGE